MSTSPLSPETPLPSCPQPAKAERAPARAPAWAGMLFKGFVNLVTILLVVYLTYFFTVFFSTPAAGPKSSTEAEKALAKKAEELRAHEQEILSSYGKVDPATKSVRIPVERAMELIAAESARPLPAASPTMAAVAPTPAPSPVAKADAAQGGQVVTTPPATPVRTTTAVPETAAAPPKAVRTSAAAPKTVAPASAVSATAAPTLTPTAAVAAVVAPPAPARAGWPPEQIYMLVCASCHEPDGRGVIARKTMKDGELTPDLTDAAWQATRTDADFEHSILEGKGKIMAGRKDILAAAHTDVKEMVALMRSFRGGTKVITAVPTGPPPALAAAPPAVSTGPAGPASTPVASGTTIAEPSGPAVTPSAHTATPPAPTVASAPPSRTSMTPRLVSGGSGGAPVGPTRVAASFGAPAPTARPAGAAMGAAVAVPAAIPVSSAVSAGAAAKPRALSESYRINCLSCHGVDGTGSVVRILMPTIPDFTSRQWQTSRSDSQFQISILEGKGTLMPAYAGKLAAASAGGREPAKVAARSPGAQKRATEPVKELIAEVRGFGPPDLVKSGSAKPAAANDFEAELAQLQRQLDDVQKKAREVTSPGAKP